ncbi:hypothetical protein [Rubrivivax sp. JA1026]|uniref:YunG family protein n=1 Tax=Rubrivivax sp. JA1026 TaxID=2710888 RepID=UPI0013E99648|nr:hypothetical protein [Rubrivivax sp. JA1026]
MKHAQPKATSAKLTQLRARLEQAFHGDTAAPGTDSSIPSAGHCAAVSAIVQAEFGGDFVSAVVEGQSHWFNRLEVGRRVCDVDLAGDQFAGVEPVRIVRAGELYDPTRVRTPEQLNDETLRRALLLATRAGLPDAALKLSARLLSRELAAA